LHEYTQSEDAGQHATVVAAERTRYHSDLKSGATGHGVEYMQNYAEEDTTSENA